MARALMFQGTGSDVGKTVLVAGLCRLAHRNGIKVLPFKPQNMSNNAAVADDGGEIGRGQWLQAYASHAKSSVHMNPVLLKPQSNTGSQIIVQGKLFGRATGCDYQKMKSSLLDKVMESYQILAQKCDLILIEGAGSAAEINLRHGDIANMGFARRADIPVILIGDIDRGGVIASLVGTSTVLDPADRAHICGYLINKFRGDVTLFKQGVDIIGRFTGWPCFGIIPWLEGARLLPAEDSMALEHIKQTKRNKIKIVVPLLPHIANFDDLDPLMHEKNVEIVFVKNGDAFPAGCKVVLLPGSKSTIADMAVLRERGFADKIKTHAKNGGIVIGICGGFQMLGKNIYDPLAQESANTAIEGLGLLDMTTEIGSQKITRNVVARHVASGLPLEGYEIHMGSTKGADCKRAPIRINDCDEGAMSPTGRIWGTYLHGLFNADAFRRYFVKTLGAQPDEISYEDKIDNALNKIADELAAIVNIEALFQLAR
ncbi:cobyric acid synthase [uncultured Bartonella sp.]|uniref:cobyric acid synthase n=1 Tax=uncultured Bartonella sp. TaxID=104108 RepID=UPI002620B716|nr:cobyric acid synthase [uncultured Bartonella sp.]